MSESSGSLLIRIISAYWWRAAQGELRPKQAARDQSAGNEEGLMVTSCIAHSAPKAADSGLPVGFCQPLGERDKHRKRDRETEREGEMAVPGLLLVLSSIDISLNPLQVQPDRPEETRPLTLASKDSGNTCSLFIFAVCFHHLKLCDVNSVGAPISVFNQRLYDHKRGTTLPRHHGCEWAVFLQLNRVVSLLQWNKPKELRSSLEVFWIRTWRIWSKQLVKSKACNIKSPSDTLMCHVSDFQLFINFSSLWRHLQMLKAKIL